MNHGQKHFPFVSIITLNYNGTVDTCRFLESTRQLTYKNYEVLVCDMHSAEDPTPAVTAGNYPNTKILLSHKNLGFAGGNNWGMRQARGDYFLIINNDTEVHPNLLEELLEPFTSNNSIGATCPKIKYFDNPSVIQYAGFAAMNMFTGRTHTIGDKETDKGQYETPGFTNGAHGCAMMVKKEMCENTGMFPEKFFLYYEEWDWSMRMLKKGYKIFYQPTALVLHKESMSVGKNSLLKTYYLSRNRILFMRRNCSTIQLIVFFFFYSFFTFPKTVFTSLLGGDIKGLKAFCKAVWWNIVHSKESVI